MKTSLKVSAPFYQKLLALWLVGCLVAVLTLSSAFAATYTNPSTPRIGYTSILLQTGKVLVVGGSSIVESSYLTPVATAELFDPATNTWSATGGLSTAREAGTFTLLPNGKVLASGGVNSEGYAISSAELYNPVTGTWITTGNLPTVRSDHTATLLLDGRVLLIGGEDDSGDPITSGQVYNPTTELWITTGSFHSIAYAPKPTLLSSGQVLVIGATESDTSVSELYDPANHSWSATGNLPIFAYGYSTTLLANGKVLLVGGGNDGTDSYTIRYRGDYIAYREAYLYDPTLGIWTATGSLSLARQGVSATVLPNDKVLVSGGYGVGDNYVFPFTSAEIYDPITGIWSNAPVTARRGTFTTFLTDGKVLIIKNLFNEEDEDAPGPMVAEVIEGIDFYGGSVPDLAVPENLTIEATSADGAVATFTPTATDPSGPPVVVATPSSGSVFPLGVTTVNVTATNAANEIATGSFTVTVQDTSAPSLTVPANIATQATGPDGAAVTFSPTATDAVSTPLIVSTPASGSLFPLGDSTVNVTATDGAGNVSNISFIVTGILVLVDTTAPTLTLPEDFVVSAATTSGTVVTFIPTATDDVSTPVILASPASGSLFAVGTHVVNVTATDAAGNIATDSFTITVQTLFHKGIGVTAHNYNGLATTTILSTTPEDHVGAITFTLGYGGTFSGKLALGGTLKPLSYTGHSAVDGSLRFGKAASSIPTLVIVRPGKSTLTLSLTLDRQVEPQIGRLSGTLKDSSDATVATITADRAIYTSKISPTPPLRKVPNAILNPVTDKGKYTVLLQAKTPAEQGVLASAFPQGNGWAQLTVAKTGIVKAVGKLADGTPFTCAQPLSQANEWPFYVALYKGKGSISGVVSFRDVAAQSDADGLDLRWFKPASLTDKTYRDGWGVDGILTDLSASKYVPPVVGSDQSALLLPGNVAPTIAKNATLELNDGLLLAPASLDVSISDKSKVSFILPTSLQKPKVTINAKTGGITGSFTHPVSLKTTAFSGVIFQKQQYGSGYFLGAPAPGSPTTITAESGAVSLAP